MARRPGIMIYFDIRPALEFLSIEERGLLLDAMMDYGELGTVPEFESTTLKVAWAFIQPKLNHDAAMYEEKCKSSQYAVYCREARKKGIACASREEWEADQLVSDDINCDPTSITSSTIITKSSQLQMSKRETEERGVGERRAISENDPFNIAWNQARQRMESKENLLEE